MPGFPFKTRPGTSTPQYPSGADPESSTRRDVLRAVVVGLAAPPVLAACSGGGPAGYGQTIADARVAIRKVLSVAPSVSVALAESDRLVWAEAFGVIDKASAAAPTTETLYCVGSCSKMLAAAAVMMLVERGRVELDAPYVRYVPRFTMASPAHRQITVRMLLDHSSGLPGADYRGLFVDAANPRYAAQVLRTLSSARLKHAPGEMSVYCNDGFTLVEPLVEAVTGAAYPEFVAREILRPLGMERSRYALVPFDGGSFAPGYDGETKLPQEFTVAFASGGLYTTPSEMTRFARMLMNGGQLDGVRLLRPESIAEMGRNQTVDEPLRPVAMNDGFRLGWDGVAAAGLAAVGVRAWHKAGGTDVYSSDLIVAPDDGFAVVITGAAGDYGAHALAERILLNALAERGRIATVPSRLVGGVLPPAGQGTDAAVSAGVYASYDALLRLDALTDGTIAMRAWKGDAWSSTPTRLRLREDGWYSSDEAPLECYRFVVADGARYLVSRAPYGMGHYLAEFAYAQRVAPKAWDQSAWLQRIAGTWVVVNEPAGSWNLRLYDATLRLRVAAELPGHLIVGAGPLDGKHDQVVDASASDRVASMSLKIPYAKGRDLDDLVVELRAGAQGEEEWMRLGSTLFRPARSVPAFAGGDAVLRIGDEGFAEWRRITSLTTVAISGATAWRSYDGALRRLSAGGAGTASVPAGGYLMLFGAPGAAIRLSTIT